MSAFPPTDGAMVPLDTARCLSLHCCQRVEAHHLAWKGEGHGYPACPHRRRHPPGAWRYYQQLPENLSRKGCAPIIREPRWVTWGASIFVVFYSGDHPHADPQTTLSR